MATPPLCVLVASSLEKIVDPIAAEDVLPLTLPKEAQAGTASAAQRGTLESDSALEFVKRVCFVSADYANGESRKPVDGS